MSRSGISLNFFISWLGRHRLGDTFCMLGPPEKPNQAGHPPIRPGSLGPVKARERLITGRCFARIARVRLRNLPAKAVASRLDNGHERTAETGEARSGSPSWRCRRPGGASPTLSRVG